MWEDNNVSRFMKKVFQNKMQLSSSSKKKYFDLDLTLKLISKKYPLTSKQLARK